MSQRVARSLSDPQYLARWTRRLASCADDDGRVGLMAMDASACLARSLSCSVRSSSSSFLPLGCFFSEKKSHRGGLSRRPAVAPAPAPLRPFLHHRGGLSDRPAVAHAPVRLLPFLPHRGGLPLRPAVLPFVLRRSTRHRKCAFGFTSREGRLGVCPPSHGLLTPLAGRVRARGASDPCWSECTREVQL